MNTMATGRLHAALTILALGVVLTGCGSGDGDWPGDGWETLTVKASSYTLSPTETRPAGDGVGAFGVKLDPADKIVAVSRDLLRAGLGEGTEIRIDGLPGTYTVLDTMHRRWEEKIDILFAKRARAVQWGVQTVDIAYRIPD